MKRWTPSWTTAALAAVLIATPATAHELFTLEDPATPRRALSDAPLATYRIDLNVEALEAGADVERLYLPIPGRQALEVEKLRGLHHGGRDYDWTGTFGTADGLTGAVALAMRDGFLAAIISDPRGTFQIGPDIDGQYLLRAVDDESWGPCQGGERPQPSYDPAVHDVRHDERPSEPRRGKGGVVTIDVLVVYTLAALQAANGAIEAEIATAGALANLALINTGSKARFNLLPAELHVVPETGDLNADLSAIQADPILALRRQAAGADLVALIVEDGGGYCGMAYTMSMVGDDFSPWAYSVTARGCFANHSLAHELGHNLGLEHNPEDSETEPDNASYRWSYGHIFDFAGSGFRTVMSYDSPCHFSCPRIPFFSNPDKVWGIGLVGTEDRDNHRTLDEGDGEGTAAVVAAFLDGSYDEDRYEPNDEGSAAYDLSNHEGEWLREIFGEGVQADEDWFEIEIRDGFERVEIDLRFVHSEGDIDLALHDASGVVLAESTSTSDDEFIAYTVPSAGTYTLRVAGDDACNLYDLRWQSRMPDQPDLIVEDAVVTSTDVLVHEAFKLFAILKNQGTAVSEPVTLTYYRSVDSTISPLDEPIGTQAIGGLIAGKVIAVSMIYAPFNPGVYWLGACIAPASGDAPIGEPCSPGRRVTVRTPPDLTVSAFGVGNVSPLAGERLAVEARVLNEGGTEAPASTVRFLLGDDPAAIGQTEIGASAVGSLAASAAADVGGTVDAPADPGMWWITACVDPVATESETSDQCSESVPIQVRSIDQPPRVIEPIGAVEVTEGELVEIDLTAHFSDPEGAALTFSQQGLPRSLTLSPEGRLHGTPATLDLADAPYAVTVTVTDPGGLEARDVFDLDIRELPAATLVDGFEHGDLAGWHAVVGWAGVRMPDRLD